LAGGFDSRVTGLDGLLWDGQVPADKHVHIRCFLNLQHKFPPSKRLLRHAFQRHDTILTVRRPKSRGCTAFQSTRPNYHRFLSNSC
jgi:hypothetical protein